MTDLVFAWENWRFSWYKYEDVIVKLINDHCNKWLMIVSFIANDIWIDINEYFFIAETCPKTVEDVIMWGRKPPKADMILYFTNKTTWKIIERWVSIKSSNISIQVLITNVTAFLAVCEWYWIDVSDTKLRVWLSKFCGFWQYKPSLILQPYEIELLEQWHRDRWLIHELEADERASIHYFFEKNQKIITEIVLMKWSWREKYWADYYLVNNNKFSDTWIVDFKIDNMENVINRTISKWYTETSQWSFHIGYITVQMKWSWKWEAYHWLQFNKSGI